MIYEEFKEELATLKRYTQNKREKPHKLILLLAALDLIESGEVADNRFYFDEKLQRAFDKRFAVLADKSDWAEPSKPFFHLRTSSFWRHKIISGREQEYGVLTTSGGGSKRIRDNIEYAYFADESWEFVKHPAKRDELKLLLAAVATNTQKLGTAFHEQFKLNRNGLSQMLRIIADNSVSIEKSTEFFQNKTSLGKNQIKSGRNYLKASGLTDDKLNTSAFGQTVLECDSTLSKSATQWVLHYYLAVRHSPSPHYWNRLAAEVLSPGRVLSSSGLVDDIKRITTETGAVPLAFDTYREAAAVFIGTYSDPESLGTLGFLEPTSTKDQYVVRQPRTLPVAAFAVILADYWEREWPDRTDVLLEDVTKGTLAHLLLLSENKVNELLAELAAPDRMLVRRQRKHEPYQVLRQDKLRSADLWAGLYN